MCDDCVTGHSAEDSDATQTTVATGTGEARRRLFATARLEAFSDGVFAIAITLLVLDLVVPGRGELGHESLGQALAHEWPAYFAYLVSFLVIGIIWINHHVLCTLARRVDRVVLFANLALLLTVSVIPFPTRLVAEYLTDPGSGAHTAAAVYSGVMTAMGTAFAILFLAVTRDVELLHHALPALQRRRALQRFGVGGVVYVATIGLSYVSAYAALIVHAILALYYAFDQLSPTRAPASS